MQDEKNVANKDLGNFGFLMGFDKNIMFHFAQLAESNLYVNKKLCAANIRQLLESFLDLVIEKEGIAVPSDSEKPEYEPKISQKIDSVLRYYNDGPHVAERKFGRSIFQRRGRNEAFPTKMACPPYRAFDGNTYNSTWTWRFFLFVGNAGSHSKSESGTGLLQERYLRAALVELERRIRKYLYDTETDEFDPHADDFVAQHEKNLTLASNIALYPERDAAGRFLMHAPQQAGAFLPAYTTQLYFSVVPSYVRRPGGTDGCWTNRKDRYYFVWRFRIPEKDRYQDFVLHAQNVSAVLRNRRVRGIAPYTVLTNIRDGEDYYIAAYEFPSKPHLLSVPAMIDAGVLQTADDLRYLLHAIMDTVQQMMTARVYHRALNAASFQWCRKTPMPGDNHAFDLCIDDLEVCKSYLQADEDEETGDAPSQYRSFAEMEQRRTGAHLPEYAKDPRTEEEIAADVTQRTRAVCLQVLAGARPGTHATADELRAQIAAEDNLLVQRKIATPQELAELLADVEGFAAPERG